MTLSDCKIQIYQAIDLLFSRVNFLIWQCGLWMNLLAEQRNSGKKATVCDSAHFVAIQRVGAECSQNPNLRNCSGNCRLVGAPTSA